MRARGHTARREYAQARALLEAIATERREDVQRRLLLSRVLLQQGGDSAAAESALREVLALDPENCDARYDLGVLEAGRTAGMRQTLERSGYLAEQSRNVFHFN